MSGKIVSYLKYKCLPRARWYSVPSCPYDSPTQRLKSAFFQSPPIESLHTQLSHLHMQIRLCEADSATNRTERRSIVQRQANGNSL